MKPLADCRLYAFVDTAYLEGRSPETVARQLCDGGADLIQLRAKSRPPDEILKLADKLAGVLAGTGAGLVVNDFPSIAAAVGASFVHLGQEDFFDAGYSHVSQVADKLQTGPVPGARLRVGLSTHSPEQAERAILAQADYIAVGPVFATGTKPTAKPVSLEYVRWAARHVTSPWFAIGGITLDNLDAVLETGARRICVVSAILRSADVAGACQKFKDRLLSARRESPTP